MGKFLSKMERKFGKNAVPHLTYVIIGCYVIGYLLLFLNPQIVPYMTLDPYAILHGEVWRIITWVIVPPSSFSIFTIIMLFFYLSIGRSLENAWGDFKYNLYIFGGMLLSLIGAFVIYFAFSAAGHFEPASLGYYIGASFQTYYICMSLLLAFAATFPDVQVLLYFIIPIKIKWLGVFYVVIIGFDIFQQIRAVMQGYIGNLISILAILISLLNFIIFFLITRDFRRQAANRRRQAAFKKSYQQGQAARPIRPNRPNVTYGSGAPTSDGNGAAAGQNGASAQAKTARHRCDICGKTDLTHPDMDFRYCSRCAGAHEYCSYHLFTHEHIK
ncbi:MAG: hypothetical protein Q4B73_04485 [Lachnospiraceae bacterium]|nr:hypothetical protein [Lachnospiraceae bacterium]